MARERPGRHRISARLAIPTAAGLCFITGFLWAFSAAAQGTPDIYRIKDNAFGSRVEYHGIKVPKGGEVTLADLKGPAKVTYWYQAEPHQSFALQPFTERTAPSRAADYR